MSAPRVTLGPIIGRVTHNTARILVETNCKAWKLRVQLRLVGSAGDNAFADASSVHPNRPVAVTVSLRPESTYHVSLAYQATEESKLVELPMPGMSAEDPPVVRTPRAIGGVGPSPYRVAVVSCNKVYVGRTVSMWGELAQRVKRGEVDTVLHMGDQVYADHDYHILTTAQSDEDMDAERKTPQYFLSELEKKGEDCMYVRAKVLLQSVTREQWVAQIPTIEELYRSIYRDTWSMPDTAYVLSHVSNLMIMDDHEIVDDWGQVPEDYDNTLERFIARRGYTVFREYQAQLRLPSEAADASDTTAAPPSAAGEVERKREEVSPPTSDGRPAPTAGDDLVVPVQPRAEHLHLPALHPPSATGLLTLDARGKSFGQPRFPYHPDAGEPFPLLGSQQWDHIEASLAPDGSFKDVRVLLVVSAVPFAFMGRTLSEVLAKRMDDVNGHWAMRRHDTEMVKLLGVLHTWQKGRPSRQVVLLGGDVHIGGYTDLLYNGEVLFKQLISSPIANITPTRLQKLAIEIGGRVGTNLTADYSFRHSGWTNRVNFGLVRVQPSTDTSSRDDVELRLVAAPEPSVWERFTSWCSVL